MKELKDLPLEERVLITISCEPFYLGFKRYKYLNSIHNHLSKYFPPKYSKDLWVFIKSTIDPMKYGTYGCIFPLDKNNFTQANTRNESKISYTRCKDILNKLHDLGYITFYKGFYDHYSRVSCKSCYIMNDKLISLYDTIDIGKVKHPTPKEVLTELRDGVTGELISDLGKLRGINPKRDLVKRFNDLLRVFDLRCKTSRVCAVYKRVFTDTLDHHGRWYSQSRLQTIRSTFRQHLTINGQATTEVDYCHQHPRILYELEGISKPYNWEPYADLSSIIDGDKSELRSLSKVALLCILNSESIGKAKAAIFKNYLDGLGEDFNFKISKGDINKIVDLLVEVNSEISHWFGKPKLWAVLQHYDSEMTALIIEEFIERGKCILPWHDSFVVAVDDRDLLIESMRLAWKKVLGSNNNCFYEVEF